MCVSRAGMSVLQAADISIVGHITKQPRTHWDRSSRSVAWENRERELTSKWSSASSYFIFEWYEKVESNICKLAIKEEALNELFIWYWWSTPGRQQGRQLFICMKRKKSIWLINSRPFLKHVYTNGRKQAVKLNVLMLKSLTSSKIQYTFASNFCLNYRINESMIRHGWKSHCILNLSYWKV